MPTKSHVGKYDIFFKKTHRRYSHDRLYFLSAAAHSDQGHDSSSPLVLILLGPPGSGKGTQAVMLKEKLNLPHISTGDLLRDHVRRETQLGKQAKTFMDKGQLVPDQLILDMLFERVSLDDCAQGYILDGFPRTIPRSRTSPAPSEWRNPTNCHQFGSL